MYVIYIVMNNSGPRIEPCGTPVFILQCVNSVLPTETYWYLSDK